MKYILSVLSIIFLTSIFLFHVVKIVYAQNVLAAPNAVNLSDAIYADLAVRGYLDNVSVVYANGKSANDIKLNETRHWLPASTIKTYAALYAYQLINHGKL